MIDVWVDAPLNEKKIEKISSQVYRFFG